MFASGFSALTDLVGIVAILNPLGVIPIFISLSQNLDPPGRKTLARSASSAVAIIMLLSAFAGKYILHFFGISIPDFRIAGGILILLIGLSMLNGQLGGTRHTPEEEAEGQTHDNNAVVPLAIPLLAGPGVISTVIVDENSAVGLGQNLILAGILLVASLTVFLALRAAVPISKRLGITGIRVATRISGLILSSIAVAFITGGLGQIFPGLR